jgi:hypothetical protein
MLGSPHRARLIEQPGQQDKDRGSLSWPAQRQAQQGRGQPVAHLLAVGWVTARNWPPAWQSRSGWIDPHFLNIAARSNSSFRSSYRPELIPCSYDLLIINRKQLC